MNAKDLFLKIIEFGSKIVALENNDVSSFETSEIGEEEVKIKLNNIANKELANFSLKGKGITNIGIEGNTVLIKTEYNGENGVVVEENRISLDDEVIMNSEENDW